jgi:hypothetical protein
MASTLRLYVDASYAVAIMAVAGIISGFVAAGITGDTQRSLQVALAMFTLTGAVLAVRLWRVTREHPAAEARAPEADDYHQPH